MVEDVEFRDGVGKDFQSFKRFLVFFSVNVCLVCDFRIILIIFQRLCATDQPSISIRRLQADTTTTSCSVCT